MPEAQAELTAIGRRAAFMFPATNAHLEPHVIPYVHPFLGLQDASNWEFVVMQAMLGLLLVIVAINVAILIYARTATRQGEIAVRTALGASRRRIVGELFTEALALSGSRPSSDSRWSRSASTRGSAVAAEGS